MRFELNDQVLVSVLAATDALWLPNRHPGNRERDATVNLRRRDFPKYGVPWNSSKIIPGANEAARKEIQREVETQATYGLLVQARRAERTQALRLTERGAAYARFIVGLPLTDALPILDRLWDMRDDPRGTDFLNRPWAPETALTGSSWGSPGADEAFAECETMLLPALAEGLVISNCSLQGHGWYSLTPLGAKLAKERIEEGERGGPRTMPDGARKEAAEFYLERIEAELALLGVPPLESGGELGLIPMPLHPILRGQARKQRPRRRRRRAVGRERK